MPSEAYYIVSPTAKNQRVSFSIVHRYYRQGKCIQERLYPEALLAINQQLFEGQIQPIQAKLLLKEVVKKLKPKKTQIQFNAENLDAYNQFWKAKYKYKDIRAPQSAKSRYLCALRVLGSLSIRQASQEEMQKKFDKLDPNLQRSRVTALNSMLRFFKRDFQLFKKREEILDVQYLTPDELEQMIGFIENEDVRLLCRVAFATGCRQGEIYGLRPGDLLGDVLHITGQMDKKGGRTPTKTERIRKAIVLPGYVRDVERWIQYSDRQRMKLRHVRVAAMVHNACIKAFKKHKNKHCIFMDLRHSYAIYLIRKGVSMFDVSRFLGNSLVVCEKYYVGFEVSSDMLDNARKKL